MDPPLADVTVHYLVVGDASTLERSSIHLLLADSGGTVETADAVVTAARLLSTRSITAIILLDRTHDRVLDVVGDEHTVIAIYDGIDERLPDKIATDPAVSVLHATPSSEKHVVEQIRSIATRASLEDRVEQFQQLRSTILEIHSNRHNTDTAVETEQLICDTLVDSGLYQMAYISYCDNNRLLPSTSAGVDLEHLDSRTANELNTASARISDRGTSVDIPVLENETLCGCLTVTTTRSIDRSEATELESLGNALQPVLNKDQIDCSSEDIRLYLPTFSHELRTYLQYARAELDSDADPQTIEQYLDRIEQVDQRARLITRESLDDEHLTPMELEDLVESVDQRMTELSNPIEIVDSTTIEVCPPLGELLLENLFRNTNEHAGLLTPISVGRTENGFFVEDSGSGTAANPSSTPEKAVKRNNHSPGTGLSIVRRVATLHNWEQYQTPSEDGGVRFEFSPTAEEGR